MALLSRWPCKASGVQMRGGRELVGLVAVLAGLYGGGGALIGLLFGQPWVGLLVGALLGVLAMLPIRLLMGAALLNSPPADAVAAWQAETDHSSRCLCHAAPGPGSAAVPGGPA